MKYVLALMLAASAAFAAARDPSASPALRPASTAEPQPDPPWLTDEWQAAGLDGTDVAAESDGHSHMGHVHAAADLGQCPRDRDDLHDADESPELAHAASGVHVHEGAQPAYAGTPKVARSIAPNGHTVAEVHAERAKLDQVNIRVRGAVVKRTDGILGKSFLHLQDGTGSVENGDFDLTVTTEYAFEVGETVEVEGRLTVDRDLGMGYRYVALLEGASRVVAH